MKVYKYLPPYKKDGKTTFPNSKNRSGVYLIRENGKLVYVGRSGSNLYKTMYRHFETWNHSQQEVISYKRSKFQANKDYTVRVIFCTAKQATALEKALILKYKPRDNAEKYNNYELSYYDNVTTAVYKKTQIETDLPF